MSLTKNPKPPKTFALQTGRLGKSFECLNSSLVQSAAELYLCKQLV